MDRGHPLTVTAVSVDAVAGVSVSKAGGAHMGGFLSAGRLPRVAAIALFVGVSACGELDVANPNQADRDRALASADDVETLISSSFQQYWGVAHYWNTNALALNHMSSRHTATWGNFGMNDLGREPREALPNAASYSYAYVFESSWQNNYGGISAASDGLRALDTGLEIGPGGERNARARAFATFVQGLSSCNIALTYDQGFIIDETVDIGGELTTVDYDAFGTYALGKLDQAEALARGNSFMLEANWINGNPLSNTEFADLIVTYKARCRANQPRSASEAAAVNWTQVSADAANGLGTLIIDGEDSSSDTPWWDGIKALGTENATWHRQHMDWAGMADQSGEYQDWLTFETQTRTARQMTFNDARYPSANVDGQEGLYHRFNATIIFRPERGTYRQSHYGDLRHDSYLKSCSFCYFGPIEEIIPVELRLYEAEAAFRMGNVATTVAIVNETRVANGALQPVVDGGVVPGGAACTPKKRYDVTGACGTLEDALIWEHFEEIWQLSGGLEFWHGRRFGILPANTATMLPIPASDLEVLQLPLYTFGGPDGSAPGTAPAIIPGDLNSALERAGLALRGLQRQRAELNRTKMSTLVVR